MWNCQEPITIVTPKYNWRFLQIIHGHMCQKVFQLRRADKPSPCKLSISSSTSPMFAHPRTFARPPTPPTILRSKGMFGHRSDSEQEDARRRRRVHSPLFGTRKVGGGEKPRQVNTNTRNVGAFVRLPNPNLRRELNEKHHSNQGDDSGESDYSAPPRRPTRAPDGQRKSGQKDDSDASPCYSPTSPNYSPISEPLYSPTSPHYSPLLDHPAHGPGSAVGARSGDNKESSSDPGMSDYSPSETSHAEKRRRLNKADSALSPGRRGSDCSDNDRAKTLLTPTAGAAIEGGQLTGTLDGDKPGAGEATSHRVCDTSKTQCERDGEQASSSSIHSPQEWGYDHKMFAAVLPLTLCSF